MRFLKQKLLEALSFVVRRFPVAVVLLSLALAAASGFYTYRNLQFDNDQDNLISSKKAYHQRYKSFLSQFGDLEYIYVVFDASKSTPQETKAALRALAEKAQQHPELFKEVLYQTDLSVLQNRAFLFMPKDEFNGLVKKLDLWSSDIIRISWANDYADLLSFVAEKLQMPTETLKSQSKEIESSFGLLEQLMAGLDDPEKIKEVSGTKFFNPLLGISYNQDPEGYFSSPDGKLFFLQLLPAKDYTTSKVIEAPLNELREEMKVIQAQFPKVDIGATGRPVLQADEMSSTGNDSVWAGIASFIGVSLLYVIYFRNGKRPLMGILSLICGMTWSIGFTTLTIGHLNLLTLVFGIILIGLGIDYGIHFILRYQRGRHDGLSVTESVHETIMTSAGAIITGAFTSTASFLSALFADFLGLQELGFVAGTGIIFCLISQIVTLPALLVIFDKTIKRPKQLVTADYGGLDRILVKPKMLLLILLAITAAGVPFIGQVRFESNLLKLQDPALESVRMEHKIIENSNVSTWVAAMLTPSREKLRELQEKVSKLPSVGATDSILSLTADDQEERITQLEQVRQILFVKDLPQSGPVNPGELHQSLYLLNQALERIQALAFQAGQTEAVEKIDALMERTSALRQKVEKSDPALLGKIQESQNYFIAMVKDTLTLLLNNLSPKPVTDADLPDAIRKRYVSSEGNYVLYAYPEEDIWQPEKMDQFILELRTIDPKVTGSPVQVFESASRMQEGFTIVGALSLIMVLIVLWLDFGTIRHTLLATVPLTVGVVWLVELMGIFHIDLSLANFFALPILLGIGVDNGVHLVHRYRETSSIRDMLHSITPAILLSTLTTVIGFGALALVRHRGLASFGKIMTLGSITCLLAALLIVPLLLKIFAQPKDPS